MNEQTKLFNDLVIVFGFSKLNAKIAIGRYILGDLNDEENYAVQFISKHKLFNNANTVRYFDDDIVTVLNKLNYSISNK